MARLSFVVETWARRSQPWPRKSSNAGFAGSMTSVLTEDC
jgi:hypothetical protein